MVAVSLSSSFSHSPSSELRVRRSRSPRGGAIQQQGSQTTVLIRLRHNHVPNGYTMSLATIIDSDPVSHTNFINDVCTSICFMHELQLPIDRGTGKCSIHATNAPFVV